MKKKAITIAAVLLIMLMVTIAAYAVSVYQMTYLPGTTDPVTNLPEADQGTGGEAYTVSSQIPEREGYEFLYWTLDYGVANYRVTYVVNPDPIYRTPKDSWVPEDPNMYAPRDYVTVAAQLTTTVDYAYNENNEKVLGTWTFTPWDKADFEITEDTTITGGWRFEPAPAKTYKYTVYYKLYEGHLDSGTEVHAPTEGYVDALGTTVPIDAIPVNDLKPQFRRTTRIYPGFQHLDVTIIRDNFEITIWYLPKGGTS